MGSLVLANPMFKRIKKKYPGATIHVLLFEKNREIIEILDLIPSENIMTISDSSMLKFFIDSFAVLRKMWTIKFDAVIDCELFARISSIFSFLSGASIRVGFHPYTQEGLYRGSFITRPVLYNPYHHISRQFLTMVEAIESDSVPVAKHTIESSPLESPYLSFDQSEIRNVIDRLHRDFTLLRNKNIVLIYPSGGVLPIRAWPLDNYCRLTELLIRDGYAVGIIGLESDKTFANAIQSRIHDPACIDLTGYTKTIRELMILFHRASLLITNDGGPAQFAALTPISTIIFFGPETPALYGPLDRQTTTFYLDLPCSPCLTAYNHRNSPCDGNNQCLKGIDPEQVYAKVRETLVRDMDPENYKGKQI